MVSQIYPCLFITQATLPTSPITRTGSRWEKNWCYLSTRGSNPHCGIIFFRFHTTAKLYIRRKFTSCCENKPASEKKSQFCQRLSSVYPFNLIFCTRLSSIFFPWAGGHLRPLEVISVLIYSYPIIRRINYLEKYFSSKFFLIKHIDLKVRLEFQELV